MTTTEPPLTPGQHVLVEAKVINFDSGIPVLRVAGSRSQAHFDPAEVRWRPMPDETAAENERCQSCDHAIDFHRSGGCEFRAMVAAPGQDPVCPCWVVPPGVEPSPRPAAEPLAAGVPVGSLPGEPGPGAYLIGDLLAVRFVTDRSDACWAVEDTSAAWGYGWHEWDEIRDRHPDKPMRRLLPRTEPDVATLEVTGEPLTLDAIRNGFNLGDIAALLHKIFDLRDERVRTLTADRDSQAKELDARRAELATHRAAQVRLMQHLGMEGIPAEVADAAIRAVDEATRRRDGLIERIRFRFSEEIGLGEDLVDGLFRLIDEARRERDAAIGEAGRLRRERDWHIEAGRKLRQQIHALLNPTTTNAIEFRLEAQEPAQTPGGGE